MAPHWLLFTEYLKKQGMENYSNRGFLLGKIPPKYRQKDDAGNWRISPNCPTIEELNFIAKGGK